MREVLTEIAGISGYFRLAAGVGSRGTLAELYAGTGLDELIDDHARRLGTTERRVAASIFFQGFAARIVSPLLGVVAARGVCLDLPAATMTWGVDESLWIDVTDPRPVGGGDLARETHRQAVDGHLRPLIRAVRAEVGVSERLLWGNAASALAGAVRMLERGPYPIEPVIQLAGAVLGREPFVEAGAFHAIDGITAFRRSNCCLYYRVPGGGLCGDCGLPAARR